MTTDIGTTSAHELAQVLHPGQTYESVTRRVVGVPTARPGWVWVAGLGLALAATGMMAVAIAVLLALGVGVWGIRIPTAWGFAIVNFVWWIGIGHAGTLISAILLLVKQTWRNSINRLAEAMTLFAVANAGLFPLLHLGRIERFYYLLPYPNTMGLWPQWRSPLVWDVIAVLTYFTVSLLFWYIGLIPDLASLREVARRRWARRLSGVFALGWRGSGRHWQRHQMLYLLLAGLATPLVVSVHSIVSLDFSTAIVPGWHSTVFPPYFVAGAIFSGFAMVLTIAVPLRVVFGFQDIITTRHLDNMGKIMLVSGLIVAYGYVMEGFTAWFSGEQYERFMLQFRVAGEWAPIVWVTILCNVVAAQALWFNRVRRSGLALFIVAQFVNVGMWTERYMIVVMSLMRDYVPSRWGTYLPTVWDWMLFLGSLGFFLLLLLLFIRLVPIIPVYELRELIHRQHEAGGEAERTPHQREPREPPPRRVDDDQLHGIAAVFAHPEQLIDAARRTRDAGYRRFDAYTPMPLPDLPNAMGLGRTAMPLIVLIGGALGAGGAYFMQWYAAVIDYPWNIGGRPLHSWPSFIPLTFELGVLGGALAGVVGLIVLNRFPQPYHPMVNVAGFERAQQDRFFLCIERDDPRFDREETWRFCAQFEAEDVTEVPK
ncbi:MAG: quinol:electron acceptor oxidoreductase subunit ActD [Phycisphaeraceae bacterium]